MSPSEATTPSAQAECQAVFDTGIAPRLAQFLFRDDAPLLQSVAVHALTNIASGSGKPMRSVISVR